MTILLPVVLCLSLCALAFSVWLAVGDARSYQKEKRLRALAGPEDARPHGHLIRKPADTSRAESLLGALIDMGRLESLLLASDTPLSAERFLFLCLTTGGSLFVVLLFLFRNPFLALAFLALGALAPVFYLLRRKQKREEDLVRQLPEALDMIVRALRVGQSLDGAFRELGADFPPPLGAEVRTIYEEMAMGIPFESAVRNFELRFPKVADIKLFCTALIIQRETGGNLTRILDGLSRMIRERFTLRRQVRALTAEGRTSALILGLLPVGFIILTWLSNPEYLNTLFTTPVGHRLLFIAVLLEAFGFIVMRVMAKIEV